MGLKKNIGFVDRAARILIGIVLLAIAAFAVVGPRNPLAFLGLAGLIPLIAGIVGYCPPYAWLGINTYKKHSRAQKNLSRGQQCI